MALTLPIANARNRLMSLPEHFEENPALEYVTVTRRGNPVLAILPWELFDSITETLEILADPDLMSSLRQSIKEIQEGKTEEWDTVKAELGL